MIDRTDSGVLKKILKETILVMTKCKTLKRTVDNLSNN